MQNKIQELLYKLDKREQLLELFREVLGFDPSRISRVVFDTKIKEIEHAEIFAESGGVRIFFVPLNLEYQPIFEAEQEIKKVERQFIVGLQPSLREHALFVFSDKARKYWDFTHPSSQLRNPTIKRFSIRPDNRSKLRTPTFQLARLKIDKEHKESVYQKLADAFSVEAVSEIFFNDYSKVFYSVKDELRQQSEDADLVHRFTHQLLNRLMFMYFVQRRGVFGKDINFLSTFWNEYRNRYDGNNQFYSKWLKPLFFEALNGTFVPRDYLKISGVLDFNSVLLLSPHLNGGLFKEDSEVDSLNVKIPDAAFVQIFDFLESYNFTARESTPLEEELEIDPEMLGNIYEMIINVADDGDNDERHKSGIFYTQRTEIEFMLRRSLVEFLHNKTDLNKQLIYQLIFPELEADTIPTFSKKDAQSLFDVLNDMTVVDPACGSGHYLVVAVQLIYLLKKELWKQLGKSEESFRPFEEKQKIIQESVFGVDVKKWATEIAKLRLWLDLFVESRDEQLYPGGQALLPNLAFKIRVGDSLVQEVGGQMFKVRGDSNIPPSLRALKNQMVKAKKDYFYGERGVSEQSVKSLEVEFFQALTEDNINTQKARLEKIRAPEVVKFQLQIAAAAKGEAETKTKSTVDRWTQEEINSLESEIDRLTKEKKGISMESHYAIWPIEFAEVFTARNGKSGFDIVIANPPYVRQELIADPLHDESEVTKKQYKDKLLRQIQLDWDDERGELIQLSKKSDLYIYFFLKGLRLLSREGVMCFISSNSWLDVEYGAAFQRVLLKRVPIIGIFDNQVKRSFKHADVNTVISIFQAPKGKDWEPDVKLNSVKFVMFKKPFEEVLFSEILWAIENNTMARQSTPEYRIVQLSQQKLFEEGREKTGSAARDVLGAYIGTKWGSLYLRAPDIYFTILEKGKDILVPVSRISKVYRGITTGINEFFYLDVETQKKWRIENEYLRPIFKSPRESDRIILDQSKFILKAFICNKSKVELKGTNALKYIQWGEQQRNNDNTLWKDNPSVQGRERWYSLGQLKISKLHFNYLIDDVGICYVGESLSSDNFQVIDTNIQYAGVLNSTLFWLFQNLFGRTSFGGGLLKIQTYELQSIPIVDAKIPLSSLSVIFQRPIMSVFEECGMDQSNEIRMQIPRPRPDRLGLDTIIFDKLGLSAAERDEVYWSLCELVKDRLEKSKTV